MRLLRKLSGGDLRSIGKSNEVVEDVLKDPKLFAEVFEGMTNMDPIIRMRSADVIEKVSSMHPEYLQPFKTRLVNEISSIEQKEVRWHVAQMFSYLKIDNIERDQIVDILISYINASESKIVITFSLQTLADLAEKDKEIQHRVLKIIERTIDNASPAITSRGKKLIKKLKIKKSNKDLF